MFWGTEIRIEAFGSSRVAKGGQRGPEVPEGLPAGVAIRGLLGRFSDGRPPYEELSRSGLTSRLSRPLVH